MVPLGVAQQQPRTSNPFVTEDLRALKQQGAVGHKKKPAPSAIRRAGLWIKNWERKQAIQTESLAAGMEC